MKKMIVVLLLLAGCDTEPRAQTASLAEDGWTHVSSGTAGGWRINILRRPVEGGTLWLMVGAEGRGDMEFVPDVPR